MDYIVYIVYLILAMMTYILLHCIWVVGSALLEEACAIHCKHQIEALMQLGYRSHRVVIEDESGDSATLTVFFDREIAFIKTPWSLLAACQLQYHSDRCQVVSKYGTFFCNGSSSSTIRAMHDLHMVKIMETELGL